MSGKVKIGKPGSFLLEGNAKENGTELSTRIAFNKRGLKPPTNSCLLYTSPSPRDATLSRMPSSA